MRASLLLLLCSASLMLFAQDRADLERQQKELQEKISYTNSLLGKVSSRQKESVSALQLVKDQIDARTALIGNYRQELHNIKNDQAATETEIVSLRKQMNRLEASYENMLRTSYRAKLLDNKWLFLLSATSFNQLFRRWQYLRQVNSFWRSRLSEMSQKQDKLEEKQRDLTRLVVQKDALLETSLQEQKRLESDKTRHSQLVSELASEEKRLRNDLKEHKVASDKLRRAIADIISEVASTNTAKELPTTPAMKKLAQSFERNRGKLPWPVRRGIISRPFGTQRHPTLKNVTTNNNGVDIRTEAAAPIHAIFEGTVVGTQYIPGFDHMLILAHGSFYTVYSYLREIDVEKGTKIRSDQVLGTARDRDGIGEVHLEIWHGKELLDPKDWLMTQ